MSPYPTPAREGHWWAKLVTPDQPEKEDWASVNWEVVFVFDNNGEGDEAFMVSVPGVGRAQLLSAFEWGPPVHPPPLN